MIAKGVFLMKLNEMKPFDIFINILVIVILFSFMGTMGGVKFFVVPFMVSTIVLILVILIKCVFIR